LIAIDAARPGCRRHISPLAIDYAAAFADATAFADFRHAIDAGSRRHAVSLTALSPAFFAIFARLPPAASAIISLRRHASRQPLPPLMPLLIVIFRLFCH